MFVFIVGAIWREKSTKVAAFLTIICEWFILIVVKVIIGYIVFYVVVFVIGFFVKISFEGVFCFYVREIKSRV